MKIETSSGGIVFKKEAEKLEILVAKHAKHHGWVFPKGLIGDKIKLENKEAAALREVEEETGVIGKIIAPLSPVTYWYSLNNVKIKKTVYYFVMRFVNGDTSKHDNEMSDVEWIPEAVVNKRLTYASDKQVWKEAREIIKQLVK